MQKKRRQRETNWQTLVSFFPANWKELAIETRANTRLRGFRSVEVLRRTLLLHVARGYSLREMVSLQSFLENDDESHGADLLSNLYTRLARNLHLTQEPQFAPQKFLSVLPALLTVKNAHFVSSRWENTMAHNFPPGDQCSQGASLRNFLDQIDRALERKEQPEVVLTGLLIQEVRLIPESDTSARKFLY